LAATDLKVIAIWTSNETMADKTGWTDIDMEQKSSSHDMISGSIMAGTTWK